MKKISVATFCNHEWHTNYGQVLQCYAMQEICKKLNTDVQIIRYREKNKNDIIKNGLPFGFLDKIYENYCQNKFIKKDSLIRIKKFQKFMNDNVNVTLPCYSVKDVEKVSDKSDILICGSDQVWHPFNLTKVVALDFGKANQKRIAYAASGIIPENKFSTKKYKELSKYLKNFNDISVREESAIDILKKYTNKDIVSVLDPTLLLSGNEWDKIAKGYKFSQPYIFCYILKGIRPYKMIIRNIMEKYNIKNVFYIDSGIESDGYEAEFVKISDAGPKEFLSLIRNASFICTDSFHGVAFSINYRKQFCTFSDKSGNSLRYDDRKNDLLNKFRIENRKCDALRDIFALEDIDYSSVENYIRKEKEKSWNFLKKAIEGE